MKLSDYIADFLARLGVTHAFVVTGGASLHMIDSIARHPDIDYVCPHHEQAGAMAADGYARAGGRLGVSIATSGPGGTNMITGICSSWYDSVAVLYLVGQVATFRFKADSGVRQMGFQETDIVEMCRPVTKYAVTVTDPRQIRYELEKALWLAHSGRPGPVLVDIPDNLQREEIDPQTLEAFVPPASQESPNLEASVRKMLEWLREAERPLVVFGWGIRMAGAEREALQFIERLGLPVNPTWATADMLAEDHPLRVGTFGTHGTRFGNFAIQNADLVISVGSRLDTHMIGSPFSTFCRGGRKVVVDIDATEVAKFPKYGLPIDLPVVADAKDFFVEALRQTQGMTSLPLSGWNRHIASWKAKYPQLRPEYTATNTLNPYVFIQALSDAASNGETIFSDTGCGLAWLAQAFQFKSGQRFFSAFNNTPMGYGLPGAIGACFALSQKRVVCVAGDGGFMMNAQELATVAHHQLPIKVFILNNRGYSMIQQTQDQWLGSRYAGSSEQGGLSFPDFEALAAAFSIPHVTIHSNRDALEKINAFLAAPGPGLCNVELRPEERVIPQVKYGRPIEDAEPLLPREDFLADMIIEPMGVSRSL